MFYSMIIFSLNYSILVSVNCTKGDNFDVFLFMTSFQKEVFLQEKKSSFIESFLQELSP